MSLRAGLRLTVALAVVTTLIVVVPHQATSQPTVTLVQFASGLSSPVDIASTPGDARLYVVERAGRIKIVEPSGVVSGTLLDITDRVKSGGEEGLLGLAFAPDYATSGRFFVYYTRKDGNNQVSGFLRSGAGSVPPGPEAPILTLSHPTDTNHNGGDLNFRGGLLYVSTGDGGLGNDPGNNAQNKESLLGKILRLDVTRDDFPTDPVRNYGIPPANPFVGTAGADEVWVLGLRNPWRFSFDSTAGHMFIGDVGESAREEIDRQAASSPGGENYGWRCYEGSQFTGIVKCAKAPAYTSPVAEYARPAGRCAVTGGYVYRGALYSSLRGQYFFMDFCSGELFAFQTNAGNGNIGPMQTLGTFAIHASSFGQGSDGELYVADLSGGRIYRLQSVPSTAQ